MPSFCSPCLDDRSLVRMRDEEGACCERCDAGHQLALRLIKAISLTQFEFFTLSFPPSNICIRKIYLPFCLEQKSYVAYHLGLKKKYKVSTCDECDILLQ